jgi:hypothetical protein
MALSERIIGINDVALGQSAQNNQTLGELEIRTEQSFVRMDEVIKNLQEPLEELGQIRNAIWERTLAECEKYETDGYAAPASLFQRLPKTHAIPQGQLEGLDERGGDPTKDTSDPVGVKSEMLKGTFRFKPRGSTETADKGKQRGDYIQFLQGLGILFQTWPVLGQTIGNNPQAASSAIEQMLRLFNIPDKQAWLGPIQQMMQLQAQVTAQGVPPQIAQMLATGPGAPQDPMGGPPPGQAPPQGAPQA